MNILCFQITMFSKNLDVLTMLLLWFSYHSYPIGDHSYLCKYYLTLCINQLFRYGNTMLTYVFNNIVKAQRTIGTMVYHRFYPRFRPMLYPRFRPMLYPRFRPMLYPRFRPMLYPMFQRRFHPMEKLGSNIGRNHSFSIGNSIV